MKDSKTSGSTKKFKPAKSKSAGAKASQSKTTVSKSKSAISSKKKSAVVAQRNPSVPSKTKAKTISRKPLASKPTPPAKRQTTKVSSKNPKSRAEEAAFALAYEKCELAFAAKTKSKCVQYAKAALDISDECMDAYTILTDEQNCSREEAIQYRQQLIAVLARVFKRQFASIPAKNYWQTESTRTCLEAMFDVAQSFEQMGDPDRAIEAYESLLSLNLEDDKGINEILGPLYLEAGRERDLIRWLKKWQGQKSAWYMYTKALYLFQSGGRSKESRTALLEAFSRNPFVVRYLIGLAQLPEEPPETIKVGEESEAAAYVLSNGFQWKDTKNSIKWADEVIAKSISSVDGNADLFNEIAAEMREEFGFENDGPDVNDLLSAGDTDTEGGLFSFNLSEKDLAELSDLLTAKPSSKQTVKKSKTVSKKPSGKSVVSKSKSSAKPAAKSKMTAKRKSAK